MRPLNRARPVVRACPDCSSRRRPRRISALALFSSTEAYSLLRQAPVIEARDQPPQHAGHALIRRASGGAAARRGRPPWPASPSQRASNSCTRVVKPLARACWTPNEKCSSMKNTQAAARRKYSVLLSRDAADRLRDPFQQRQPGGEDEQRKRRQHPQDGVLLLQAAAAGRDRRSAAAARGLPTMAMMRTRVSIITCSADAVAEDLHHY